MDWDDNTVAVRLNDQRTGTKRAELLAVAGMPVRNALHARTLVASLPWTGTVDIILQRTAEYGEERLHSVDKKIAPMAIPGKAGLGFDVARRADAHGLPIANVPGESLAARRGVTEGMALQAINDTAITKRLDILRLLRDKHIGEVVQVTVWHQGDTQTIALPLSPR